MLKQLEASIIDRLTEASITDSARVIPFPDNDPLKELGRVKTNAVILVRYVRSTFQPPETINRTPQIQKGTISFELRLLWKGLRTHVEAYPLLDQIQAVLAGYVPVLNGNAPDHEFSQQGFYLRDQGFVDQVEQIWDFMSLYSIDTTYRKRRN